MLQGDFIQRKSKMGMDNVSSKITGIIIGSPSKNYLSVLWDDGEVSIP